MTGSLQIKNGMYYAVLNLYDSQGKRRLKWINSAIAAYDSKGRQTNKKTAKAFLDKLLSEYQTQKTGIYNNILFSDYMLQWLEVIERSVEVNTFYSYQKVVKNKIAPYFMRNKTLLQDLTTADLQLFYESESARGQSPSSVRKLHANIHKALKRAVQLQIIRYNPADNVDLPRKSQKYNAQFYNAEQTRQLLAAAKGHYAESAIYITAFFGLRRSEVLGLKWKSIDFNSHTLTIKDTITTMGGQSLAKERTKNKSSYRTLRMSAEIEQYLKRLQKKQLEDRLYFGNTYHESEYVCRREDGSLLKPSYLTQAFKTLLRTQNFPIIRFHDLRHSCASLLIANGFNLKEIQEWLGHSEISTTADIYSHLESESKVRMADSLGKTLLIG